MIEKSNQMGYFFYTILHSQQAQIVPMLMAKKLMAKIPFNFLIFVVPKYNATT